MGLARKTAEAIERKLAKKPAPERDETSPETSEVRDVRAETKMSIYRMNSAEEIQERERIDLLNNLKIQYPKMQAALQRYEIPTTGMPVWEQVKKSLTPEILNKALKLAEPILLLVPPTTRQSKVEAIDKHPAEGQKYDAFIFEFKNNDLWNGGKHQTENKWKVFIVEGIQDVGQDHEIYEGKRTSYEMSKLWVKKYEGQGLDVINDADVYLTLMMRVLAEGKLIDLNTYSVLNGKNLIKSSHVALGHWTDGVVLLYRDGPDETYDGLRLRGLVEVDV